jgi:hypothetical protein
MVPFDGVAAYSIGGISTEDPGADVTDAVYYVDGDSGDNSNDGLSPENAWENNNKVEAESSEFTPGTHVLYKRGTTVSNTLEAENIGDATKPIVFGAYGPLEDGRPTLVGDLKIISCTNIMVRDLDVKSIIVSNDTTDCIVYNNVVHGSNNNGIVATEGATKISVVDNLVYDCQSNDGISVHPGSAKNAGDSHWIIGNVVIGNGDMEDCIDLAISQTAVDSYIAKDIKVIGNLLQASAINGFGTKTGSAERCINGGHLGTNIWVSGNVMAGCMNTAMYFGEKESMEVCYNIIFDTNVDPEEAEPTIAMLADGYKIENNTVIQDSAREIMKIEGTPSSVRSNLLLKSIDGSAVYRFPEPLLDYTFSDSNWYDYISAGDAEEEFAIVTTPSTQWDSLADWQSATSADQNSASGAVPGISLESGRESDPRNWDATFIATFAPENEDAGLVGLSFCVNWVSKQSAADADPNLRG